MNVAFGRQASAGPTSAPGLSRRSAVRQCPLLPASDLLFGAPSTALLASMSSVERVSSFPVQRVGQALSPSAGKFIGAVREEKLDDLIFSPTGILRHRGFFDIKADTADYLPH